MGNPVGKILVIQYALGVLYVIVIAALNAGYMFSALVGCMACLIPNTYQCMRMSRQSGNEDAVKWLGHAYRSEFAKWLMAGMIFALAFSADYEWNPTILFAGYIFLQLSSWFGPLVIKGN